MMFDISWGELLLIGVVALIVIGPKELPGVLRTLGQWTGKLRRMASEFQAQFQEAMREAEMAELKKQVDEMTSQAQSYASFDPVGDVGPELEGVRRQIEIAVSDQHKWDLPGRAPEARERLRLMHLPRATSALLDQTPSERWSPDHGAERLTSRRGLAGCPRWEGSPHDARGHRGNQSAGHLIELRSRLGVLHQDLLMRNQKQIVNG
jgi:Tat protein translocase TatB subunit